MHKIILLLFITFSLYAQNIVWNSVEFPPSLITKGPLKDQGFSDKARILMIKNLNEFHHTTKYTNSARAINNLKTKTNYCFSGLNKNKQRESFIHFSKPFMYALPHEVIIKSKNLPLFKPFINQKGRIDLEKLFQDKSLQLTYTKERSYTNFIDSLILKYKKNKNLAYRPSSDLAKGFLRMLTTNRVDYIIEYPAVVYFNSNDDFLSIPIQNSDQSFPVYIGCSKTDLGKNIIQEIDKIITQNQEELKSNYGSFLNLKTKKRYENSVQKQ